MELSHINHINTLFIQEKKQPQDETRDGLTGTRDDKAIYKCS